jgi:hypothetical protein
MPRKLNGFERMWNAYPTGSVDDVKKMIGGDTTAKWILNTCVIRVCRALNYAGHPIPHGFAGLATLRGADGMRYAIRVEEIRKYLMHMYGPPVLTESRNPPRDGVPETFKGIAGIILFQVKGWADATGHVDLWDGEVCRHLDYFHKAHQIMLWPVAWNGEVKLTPGELPVALGASVGMGGQNRPEDVARVQALLDAAGHEIGPADGVISRPTIAGIMAFQKQFLDLPDGKVDPNGRTWRRLNGL